MGKHFVMAETQVNYQGMSEFLQHVGAPEWASPDAVTGGELLAEVAGRLCYKSFAVGLNPNVTRVREGNHDYIGNILKQKHGSVLEHATTSVAFMDVTRIFTHELVRHRPGIAFSQESQRFVRLDTFNVYIPELTDVFKDIQLEMDVPHEEATVLAQENQAIFLDHTSRMTDSIQVAIQQMIHEIGLNWDKMSFHNKKQLTSAFRRFIPGGVTTNILVTANHRLWRHIIQNRTSAGAEEEIAWMFGSVARDFQVRYPAFYQDIIEHAPTKECHWEQYTFANEKV